MNSQIKTFSILGWSLALSEDISRMNKDKTDMKDDETLKTIHEAAIELNSSILNAVRVYPKFKAKQKDVKLIKQKIIQLDGFGYVREKQKRLEILLAILLVAYEDIESHLKDVQRKNAINDIIKKVVELSVLIDPEGDQPSLYVRAKYSYKRWLKG